MRRNLIDRFDINTDLYTLIKLKEQVKILLAAVIIAKAFSFQIGTVKYIRVNLSAKSEREKISRRI